MGDRAVVLFSSGGADLAAIYLHWGGSEADQLLAQFFKSQEEGPQDNRFHDPEYLAARFVHWVSNPAGLGVGITVPMDREDTNWRVHCDGRERPRVEQLD